MLFQTWLLQPSLHIGQELQHCCSTCHQSTWIRFKWPHLLPFEQQFHGPWSVYCWGDDVSIYPQDLLIEWIRQVGKWCSWFSNVVNLKDYIVAVRLKCCCFLLVAESNPHASCWCSSSEALMSCLSLVSLLTYMQTTTGNANITFSSLKVNAIVRVKGADCTISNSGRWFLSGSIFILIHQGRLYE